MMSSKEARLIKFSGKKEDWRQWKIHHLAVASTRGYRGILDGTMIIPERSVQLNEDEEEIMKLSEKAVKSLLNRATESLRKVFIKSEIYKKTRTILKMLCLCY